MSNSDKPPPLGVYKCKEMVHDIFLQAGHKDLLMAHLRHRTTQQGWACRMRDEFVEYIKKKGSNNVNVSHMITDLAPLSRELFPAELKKELLQSMFEVSKDYFIIDDTVPAITDPDNDNSEAEKTFLYQPKDVKPDPGLGVGIEVPDSPPPSPEESSNSEPSTPRQSPGPVSSGNSSGNNIAPRQSPLQNTPRQSPSTAPKHSPASTSVRPITPQPLPPPPILRPETVSAMKSESAVRHSSNEEDEPEEEDDDDDTRNEEEEEDELMDV